MTRQSPTRREIKTSIRVAPGKHPYRDPDSQPEWSQVVRWGGDRVTVLFDELRRSLASVEGLNEDLHFLGPEEGWAPRFRVGERTLFVAHIAPGSLEVTMLLGPVERERLEHATKSRKLKSLLAQAAQRPEGIIIRMQAANSNDVRSFASLVKLACRLGPA